MKRRGNYPSPPQGLSSFILNLMLSLIGYRATGKTTLAKLLAERLGWEWLDADAEIERAAGKSIARIFAEDGEPAFRDLEARVVADLCRRERLVLATGGRRRSEKKLATRCARREKWFGLRRRPKRSTRECRATPPRPRGGRA